MNFQRINANLYKLLQNTTFNTLESLRSYVTQSSNVVSSLAGYWDNYLLPLLQSLPQTKDGVNPFTNGLDGSNLYLAKNPGELYYDEQKTRYRTIREAIEYVYEKIQQIARYQANLASINARLALLEAYSIFGLTNVSSNTVLSVTGAFRKLVLVDSSSGDVEVTLPSSTSTETGKTLAIARSGANTVSIVAPATYSIVVAGESGDPLTLTSDAEIVTLIYIHSTKTYYVA